MCCSSNLTRSSLDVAPFFKFCVAPLSIPLLPFPSVKQEPQSRNPYSISNVNVSKGGKSLSQEITLEIWSQKTPFFENSEGKLAKDIFYSDCDCFILNISTKFDISHKEIEVKCLEKVKKMQKINQKKSPKIFLVLTEESQEFDQNRFNQVVELANKHDWEIETTHNTEKQLQKCLNRIASLLKDGGLKPKGLKTQFAEMDDKMLHKEVEKVQKERRRTKRPTIQEDDLDRMNDERQKRLDCLINSSIIKNNYEFGKKEEQEQQ